MPGRSLSRLWGTLFLVVGLVVPLAATAPTEAAAAGRTNAREAKRVDRVATPRIRWVEDAAAGGYRARVKLPLDYDRPRGATVTIALFKVPAAEPEQKLGTLFVNPGGPGGSGVAIAREATSFLSQGVLDRFDIVGFDPRGTNGSTEVTCFPSAGRQSLALHGMVPAFPTAEEQDDYIQSSKRLAAACSRHGGRLASAMSTAQVARDMDVLRRAVGDSRLSYLGFSYGSYLGQVYANLFPDRFRAIAVDGVIDPVAWSGTAATRGVPAITRLQSAEASWAALRAGLKACRAAGPKRCPLEDPQADFDAVAAVLKRDSVMIGSMEEPFEYEYSDFVSDVLGLLYYPQGMDYIAQIVAVLRPLAAPGESHDLSAAATRAGSLVGAFRRATAQRASGYDNALEAYSAVLCTDAYQPKYARSWVAAAERSRDSAPHFGLIWGWSDVQCATSAWKARDEDAYHGSFTRSTAAPVLVVGNYHDPSTGYAGAVRAADLLPNSVLLRSDSWGHTAYGTSDCVTDRMDAYLLTGTVPAGTATTVCTGDVQPFAAAVGPAGGGAGTATVKVPTRRGLPPVEMPWRGDRG